MSTVVDSLVVELSLDPSKYQKGMKDAVATTTKGKDELGKDAKEIESHAKGISEGFSGLSTKLLGFAAILTGGMGLKAFIESTTQSEIHVGRLSKVIGISVNELSAWRNAGLLAGGTTESFAGVLSSLALEFAKVQSGLGSEIIPLLKALDVEVDVMNPDKLKSAADVFFQIADAIQKHKVSPAQATIFLRQFGADEATIATIMKGPAALQAYLEQARKVGVQTDADYVAADNLNRAWQAMILSSSALGRSMLTELSPALQQVLNDMAEMAQWTGKITPEMEQDKNDISRDMNSFLRFFFGEDTARRVYGDRFSAGSASGGAHHQDLGPSLERTNKSDVETYIRDAARKRGIDPSVALEVYRREGKGDYVGDRGSSFGPFQLHYGGVAGGGNAVSGLGDEFTKKTGLDARDRSTVQQQVDFALDYAAKHGWSAWHGYRGNPWDGIGGAAAAAQFSGVLGAGAGAAASGSVDNRRSSTSTSSVHVSEVNVIAKDGDPQSIASGIKVAIENLSFAADAQSSWG